MTRDAMDVDWQRLLRDAAIDPGTLKRQLDLVAVCERLGIPLEDQGGKFVAHCPFHDDEHPSFDVYELDDGTQRCGCFACDFGPSNDVYDLLQRLRGYGFTDALREAQQLAAATPTRAERPPRPPRPKVDLVPFVDTAIERATRDREIVAALLTARGIDVPADWITREFGLGVTLDGGGVVIAHRDPAGEVAAAKVRRALDPEEPWTPRAVEGSRLTELYGVWRDQAHGRVILVEGESDTWTVAWLTRWQDVDVFGLPSGAQAHVKRAWAELLADRDVTLLFDADASGRAATRRWTTALGVCRVALLDEGEDATSTTPERVLAALTRAEKVGLALTPGLVEAPFEGYVVAGDEHQRPVSNFTLRLRSVTELAAGEGLRFDVTIEPTGRQVTLSSTELESDVRLRRWATALGKVWQGGTRETQELLRILQQDAVYRPRHRGLDFIGWVDGSFVLPEPAGTLGSLAWVYVPPANDAHLEHQLDLRRGDWDVEVPITLAGLHRADVVTPVLGWVAAAPLRALVRRFPTLAVVGTAGTGKTTLVSEVLRAFGLHTTAPRALTGTTPHAVRSLAGATNAIPVWIDEFREGARQDSKELVEQLIRDAWESTVSQSGGYGRDLVEIREFPARAPLLVSGESVFSEASHLERMVLILMPRVPQGEGHPGAAAYGYLRELRVRGFGRAYLEWLVHRYHTDTLPRPPDERDRATHARAVAAWGYELLEQFCHEVVGAELPAYDQSLVEHSYQVGVGNPGLFEALHALYGRIAYGVEVVWTLPDGIGVRLHDFVEQAKRLGIVLPGGPRGVRHELEQRFEDVYDAYDHHGGYVHLGRRRG